jgi:hypothetical protein
MTPPLGQDADFEDLDPDRAQADYERLLQECRLANDALAAASYDDTITARADVMSLRTVVVHMIEEYPSTTGMLTNSASVSTARRTSNDPPPRGTCSKGVPVLTRG